MILKFAAHLHWEVYTNALRQFTNTSGMRTLCVCAHLRYDTIDREVRKTKRHCSPLLESQGVWSLCHCETTDVLCHKLYLYLPEKSERNFQKALSFLHTKFEHPNILSMSSLDNPVNQIVGCLLPHLWYPVPIKFLQIFCKEISKIRHVWTFLDPLTQGYFEGIQIKDYITLVSLILVNRLYYHSPVSPPKFNESIPYWIPVMCWDLVLAVTIVWCLSSS